MFDWQAIWVHSSPLSNEETLNRCILRPELQLPQPKKAPGPVVPQPAGLMPRVPVVYKEMTLMDQGQEFDGREGSGF